MFAVYGGYYACNLKKNDVAYVSLPLYHTAGGVLGAGMFLMELTVVLRKKFSVTHFWTDIIKHDCTVRVPRDRAMSRENKRE